MRLNTWALQGAGRSLKKDTLQAVTSKLERLKYLILQANLRATPLTISRHLCSNNDHRGLETGVAHYFYIL